jgi:hypothetical protein
MQQVHQKVYNFILNLIVLADTRYYLLNMRQALGMHELVVIKKKRMTELLIAVLSTLQNAFIF